MEAFNELRKAVRARRDKLIEQARLECEKSLASITALESNILGQSEPVAPKSTTAYVLSILPADKPFTVRGIAEALEAAHPWRMWNDRSVNACINRLTKRRLVKRYGKHRVGKGRTAEFASDVLADSKLPAKDPFAEVSLSEALCRVLQGKSLPLTELTMELLAAGYKSSMSMRSLRSHVGSTVRKDSRFKRDGERWACQ